jgi:hypothetical protein
MVKVPIRRGMVLLSLAKDHRALLVDVSHLQAQFGKPLASRSDFAAGVAAPIMGYWAGA